MATVAVNIGVIIEPRQALRDGLVPPKILVDGVEVGETQAVVRLEQGTSHRIEFIPPEHPEYIFNSGIPSSYQFTLAEDSNGESFVTTFTGTNTNNSATLTVNAIYNPPLPPGVVPGKVNLQGPTALPQGPRNGSIPTIRVVPGRYTISFEPVFVANATYTTPSPFSITINSGDVVVENRMYEGTILPAIYWLKQLDDSSQQKVNTSSTLGLFSGNIPNLTTYFTGSVSTSVDRHYAHVYHRPVADPTSSIQFSITYGHSQGSGSNDEGGQYNDTPTRAIYGQYRNLILGSRNSKFNLTGVETDHFYAISYQKARRLSKLDFNALELNIAHLSGSEFINGSGYMAAHTGSNVKLGGEGKVLRLISDSVLGGDVEVGNAGLEYNIISGSIENGPYNRTAPHRYGKFYPSLGVILLDANKLDVSASFGTVTTRELDGQNTYKLFTAISGAALFPDGNSTDYLGMKARAYEDEAIHYYFIDVRSKEFNYSNNPTYRDILTGEIIGDYTTRPKVYATTIGLYNQDRDLVAVAKISQPEKKSFTDEVSYTVRLKV